MILLDFFYNLFSFFDFLWLRDLMALSPALYQFFTVNLTQYDLLFLAIGFLVILIEIRLPLKYYWGLPAYTFDKFFEGLGLRPKTPVWGYCLDAETDQIITVAAVELLDEKSKKIITTTFSNRLGQYGFLVYPGSYIVRAVKNHYKMPSFLDPENIELIQVDESSAIPVGVTFSPDFPKINIPLMPLEKINWRDPQSLLSHYARTFLFSTATIVVYLSAVGSLLAFVLTGRPYDGLLLAVAVTLLFIKIYILETVGQVGKIE
ncbi:MAG: hypothetical protein UV05_C0011G0012 [candidate division CPR1 bacterium GW2011_GWA2_42_17]|uniref:Uncharacterized protein n=1 Tax=candidate division CPR1 bacterium GW2011_GWA2_42_17 TaxID=1618341 RepID=A0A0G1BCQ3_9BACT|nr:MAG: hypothetical protein UV05_C0011G0012 [candidate division CPR1 bacterium GW2011_GWA2_42_17]